MHVSHWELAHRECPGGSQCIVRLTGSWRIVRVALGVTALHISCWELVHHKCPAGSHCIPGILLGAGSSPAGLAVLGVGALRVS